MLPSSLVFTPDTVLGWHRELVRRKKEIPTAGFACLNPLCDYFGLTDVQVHALVGNGKRGIKNDIQHFRCQWCSKDFSCRRNTPIYYLKTATDCIEMVLWLMAEGVDISVLVRYTGHADSTITRGSQRIGTHSMLLHNRYFQGLVLTFVQLDELHAKVRTGVQCLWLAIDPVTQIIPLYRFRRCETDHDVRNKGGFPAIPP